MVTIEIDVKRSDIWFGFRRSARACPIARAVHRVGFDGAKVFTTSLDLKDFGYVTLPSDANRFVNNFDAGGRSCVEPFKFQIQLPEKEVEKLNIKRSALIKCDRKLELKT